MQYHIQSYFEAGMPVWYAKLRPSKNRQIITVLLSQSHKSEVLSYSERMQNSLTFCGFAAVLHGGGLTAPPHPYPSHLPPLLLRCPSCTTVFLLATQNQHPQKGAGHGTVCLMF